MTNEAAPYSPKSQASAVIANKLVLSYAKGEKLFLALNNLSINIPQGCVYCLIGPSGCGKTTFLRCLTGFLRPVKGTITLFGRQPGDRALGIPGPNLGYMPQDISLDSDFTIAEAATYFARLYRVPLTSVPARLNALLEKLDLPPSSRQIGKLSGGQKRRVSFVCSIIHEPRLIILDEPTVGCDPLVRENMWNIIFKMTATRRTTVIITTHYIEEARRTDLIGFMRKGSILAQESPNDILRRFGVPTLEETFAILCRQERPLSGQIASPDQFNQMQDLKAASQQNQPPTFEESITTITANQRQSTTLNNLEVGVNTKGQSLLSVDNLMLQWSLFVAVFSRVFLRFTKMKWYIGGASFVIAYLVYLYATIYGTTPKQMAIGLINEEDPPRASRIVLDALNHEVIHIVPYSDLESAYAAVESKKIHGFLHFPRFYTSYAPLKYHFREPIDHEQRDFIENAQVRYVGDAFEKIVFQIIESSLTRALRTAGPAVLANLSLNPMMATWPITEGDPIYGLSDPSDLTGSKTFFMPIAIFYIAHVTGFLLSIYSLLRDRKDAVLERTYASGAGPTHILLSHMITNTLIPILTAGPVWYIALEYLHAPCEGSLGLLLVFYFVNILAAIPVSFLFAVLKYDQMFIFMLAVAYCMVGLATCGVLWPEEGLPYFMRSFRYFFPYPEIIKGAIRIMVKGCGLEDAIVCNSLLHSLAFYFISSVFVRIVF